MELNKEQAAIIIKLRESLEAYKVECKEKGLSYGSGFSKAEKAEMQDGVALLKKHYKNAVGFMEREEEIDCGNFTTAVSQWRVGLFKFFRACKTSYAKVGINVKQFKEELALSQGTLPLISSLYSEWQALLGGLEPELSGEELFEQLLNHSGATWQMTSDLAALEAHYKKNKKAYKKYESTTGDFQEKVMPKQQYFLDALKMSSSAEDPNLPENLAEREENKKAALKQLEQDKKAVLKQWEQDYKNWLNSNIDELSNIDSTEKGKVINKEHLVSQKGSKLKAPAYAQEFWGATGQAIQQAIEGEAGVVSYEKASEIAIEILDEQYQEYITEDFLQEATISKSVRMPSGLEDWLRACIDDNEALYKAFKNELQGWSKETANIVAMCEHKMEGKTYTVDLQKLGKEMDFTFAYTINGTSPGETIWQQLKGSLPEGKTTSFERLHTAWQNGIEKITSDDFARNLWSMHLTGGGENKDLEQAMTNFFNKAPSQEALVNALWDSRYQVAKKKLPILKEKIDVKFEIKSTVDSNYSFTLPIPLKMIEEPNKQGKKLQYAVPVVEGLGDKSIINHGGSSSTIDTLKEITVANPVFNYYSDSATCSTWVTIRMGITDTTEMRVVQNAKNGSMTLFNLSVDDMNKIKGVTACDGKTLRGGVEIKADKHGNIKEIQGTITLLGFDFNVHAGKEGVYLTCKSPFDFQAAVKMKTEGKDNYDLTLSVNIMTEIDPVGATWVSAREGRRGSVEATGITPVNSAIHSLEVTHIALKFVLKKEK